MNGDQNFGYLAEKEEVPSYPFLRMPLNEE